jgi:type II secretory pathway pseudopilin PulG
LFHLQAAEEAQSGFLARRRRHDEGADMSLRRRAHGFTIIEMLTVVAIMMLVMALALPNFVEMMRGRKWSAALGNVQIMITRARAFAANARVDTAVEFYITPDNGTQMWLESEINYIESMPPYQEFLASLKAGNFTMNDNWGGTFDSDPGYRFLMTLWAPSAGWAVYQYPNSGQQSPADCSLISLSYDQQAWPPKPTLVGEDGETYYGDNARQSEILTMGNGMAIDLSRSPDFASYDAPRDGYPYGKDDYPDVRVGIHGALVQTVDPTICLWEMKQERRLTYQVVRCTGRIVKTR